MRKASEAQVLLDETRASQETWLTHASSLDTIGAGSWAAPGTPGSPFEVPLRKHAVLRVEMLSMHVHLIFFLAALFSAVVFGSPDNGTEDGNGWLPWGMNTKKVILDRVNVTEKGDFAVWAGRAKVQSPPVFLSDAFAEWGLDDCAPGASFSFRATFSGDDGNTLEDAVAEFDCAPEWEPGPVRGLTLPDYVTNDGAVRQPMSGNLTVRVEVQVTSGEYSLRSSRCGGDLKLRRAENVYWQCVMRLAMFVISLVALFKYRSRCKKSADLLRPEHGLIYVELATLLAFCNPFCVLIGVPRTGTVLDVLIAAFVLHLPLVHLFVSQGVLWGVLDSLSKAAEGASERECWKAARRRWMWWLAASVVLDAVFSLSRGKPLTNVLFAGYAIADFFVFGNGMVCFIVTCVFCLMQIWWIFYVALPWFFCCTRLFGPALGHKLRMLPYRMTRDRQLLLPMFRLVGILQCVMEASMGRTKADYSIIFMSPGVVFFQCSIVLYSVYCATPYFAGHEGDLPPPPTSELWKRTKWKREWIEWVRTTVGARALYHFMTEGEEEAFNSVQQEEEAGLRGSGDLETRLLVQGECHRREEDELSPFNFEVCVRLFGLSAEAYLLEAYSPAVAAVAASCLIAVQGEAECAELAELSVEPSKPEVLRRLPLVSVNRHGYQLLRAINAQRMQVLVARRGSALAVAFRGSSNKENWKSDFDFLLTPWERIAGSRQGATCCGCRAQPLLHRGFMEAYDGVAQLVCDAIDCWSARLQPHSLYITGHSLGAACAVLCAYHQAQRLGAGGPRVSLYTFGSPLVGNRAFAQEVNRVVPRHFRVVNDRDFVTHFKFANFGLKHSGRKVLIAASRGNQGFIAPDPAWYEHTCRPAAPCFGAGAHGVEQYANALAMAGQALGAPISLKYGRRDHRLAMGDLRTGCCRSSQYCCCCWCATGETYADGDELPDESAAELASLHSGRD
eukprot:Hpha_TRINITY_DN14271_c0_g1::TRINITY_DN14271_c0_g1_i2::g.22509::m.22509